jgi:hypothetical protein
VVRLRVLAPVEMHVDAYRNTPQTLGHLGAAHRDGQYILLAPWQRTGTSRILPPLPLATWTANAIVGPGDVAAVQIACFLAVQAGGLEKGNQWLEVRQLNMT